jgi:hypothetical protein
MCMVTGCRSTSARAVTISQTYSPLTVPAFASSSSRHSVRNATFVTPAIGANTTGLASLIAPMRNAHYRPLIFSVPLVLSTLRALIFSVLRASRSR